MWKWYSRNNVYGHANDYACWLCACAYANMQSDATSDQLRIDENEELRVTDNGSKYNEAKGPMAEARPRGHALEQDRQSRHGPHEADTLGIEGNCQMATARRRSNRVEQTRLTEKAKRQDMITGLTEMGFSAKCVHEAICTRGASTVQRAIKWLLTKVCRPQYKICPAWYIHIIYDIWPHCPVWW
jgi:hypothetical protein